MKPTHLHSLFLAPLAAACLLVTAVRAEDAPTVIKFSDPAKPGTVKILLGRGDLRITGADTNEVAVLTSAKASAPKRKDGLRVLTSSAGFAFTEKDNTITLDATENPGRSSADYAVVVPRNAAVIIQEVWSGDISASRINGDIEATTANGDMKFEEIGGGLIASTSNGDINVSIREVREGKPLSLTSISGEVTLHVPAQAKANVRFRTQNGAVATDFDEKVLVTKTENAAPAGASPWRRTMTIGRGGNTFFSSDTQETIKEATRAAFEGAQEIAAAVQAGIDEAQASREDRADRRVDTAGRTGTTGRLTHEGTPPLPPRPVMPTLTGGKLVTGTLNGGGPEISVSTLNGDIVFRQK